MLRAHRSLALAAGCAAVAALATATDAVAVPAAPIRLAPPAQLKAAAGATSAAASYSFRMTMTLTAKDLPKPVHMVVTGAIQQRPLAADLAMDMSEVVALDGSKPADGRYRVIELQTADGLLLYVSGKTFASQLGGRTWGLVNVSKLPAAKRATLTKQLTSNADITSFLPLLKAAATSIAEVGLERVGTTPTTRYHAIVDLLAMAKGSGTSKADLDKLRATVGTAATTVAFDVWIDGKSLVRRMRFTLPIDTPTLKMTEEIDMTISGYSSKVSIERPGAGTVKDVTAALVAEGSSGTTTSAAG